MERDEILFDTFKDDAGNMYVSMMIHAVGRTPIKYNMPEHIAKEVADNILIALAKAREPVLDEAYFEAMLVQ